MKTMKDTKQQWFKDAKLACSFTGDFTHCWEESIRG